MKSQKPFEKKVPQQKIKINYHIKSTNVMLINEDGKNLGIVSFNDAIKQAQQASLDLIEIAKTKEGDSICKIMDFGKYKFEQQKKEKSQKQKILDVKEVQVRPVTSFNDLKTKANQIKPWLEEGHKVQIVCKFSHREFNFKDLGKNIIEDLLNLIGSYKIDQALKENERKLQITIGKVLDK